MAACSRPSTRLARIAARILAGLGRPPRSWHRDEPHPHTDRPAPPAPSPEATEAAAAPQWQSWIMTNVCMYGCKMFA